MSRSINPLPQVGLVGTYVPRVCGIGTFTHDLFESVSPPASAFVVAIDERGAKLNYPPEVRRTIVETDRRSYRAAAEFLNRNADVVNLQHEFGIFGGRWGRHVLELTSHLQVPLVTTLHTVAARPKPAQRAMIQQLAEQSERLVVINRRGRTFLESAYGISPEMVDEIPHGIPDLPFVSTDTVKPQLGLEGRTVLLSFGLLSPSKGYEYAIEALVPIVAQYPELLYVIAGTTHPNENRQFGERYRSMLEALVAKHGLEEQVRFIDRFLPQDQLHELLLAADIYLTPYPHEDQISSGTLAYAMGAGCVVVSSSFWHAAELLRSGRGVLVPPADSESLRVALDELLADPKRRETMRRRAYGASRATTWPVIGDRYLTTFASAAEGNGPLSTSSTEVGRAQPA